MPKYVCLKSEEVIPKGKAYKVCLIDKKYKDGSIKRHCPFCFLSDTKHFEIKKGSEPFCKKEKL